MRSSLRRLFILLTVWLLVFYASGCQLVSLNADSLLRAPKLTGDQAAVQQALEQYIVSRVGETQADYTLKYPKDGDRLTSFLFLDHTEEPTRAMAFYCCPALSANARILYLENSLSCAIALLVASSSFSSNLSLNMDEAKSCPHLD